MVSITEAMKRRQIEEGECEGLGGNGWQRGTYRKEAEGRRSWGAESQEMDNEKDQDWELKVDERS